MLRGSGIKDLLRVDHVIRDRVVGHGQKETAKNQIKASKSQLFELFLFPGAHLGFTNLYEAGYLSRSPRRGVSSLTEYILGESVICLAACFTCGGHAHQRSPVRMGNETLQVVAEKSWVDQSHGIELSRQVITYLIFP